MTHRNHDEVLWTLRRLRRARVDGRLVFVLGSGINSAYEVPDWSTLLIGLLSDSGRVRLPPADDIPELRAILSDIIPDPLLQAAVTRQAYEDDDRWLASLRDALQPRHPATDADKPLARIAAIVADQYSRDRRRHIAILTFNYVARDAMECRRAFAECGAKRLLEQVVAIPSRGRSTPPASTSTTFMASSTTRRATSFSTRRRM